MCFMEHWNIKKKTKNNYQNQYYVEVLVCT